ncbi:MAG: toll/interleukin-1 receptor domain-containing protein [Planctomycetota bacterium]|nr:toll/interleukin-1 receptor domain-containing protein [Planctomycetota bacterium]
MRASATPCRLLVEQEFPPLRLFYCYSHKDEYLRNQLETHLKLLERQNLILPWHDRKISGGKGWEGQIDENLEQADIILLLISADFLASNYCYDVEMTCAIERHDLGEARVIPVILRDVVWTSAPFGKLQALPMDGRPVRKWPDRDTAWRNVAEGIERVIREILESRNGRSYAR